jgi:hypothetical protein
MTANTDIVLTAIVDITRRKLQKEKLHSFWGSVSGPGELEKDSWFPGAQSSCSFAAMEIALLVTAKLPRCIRCRVPFERDRDFVGTNDLSASRRRVTLCVVVGSF